MTKIDKMLAELRDIAATSEKMLSKVPEDRRDEMRARQEFGAEVVEAFARFVDKLDLPTDEPINPPDLFIPAALTAAAICTKVIRHLHPLGACDDCTETARELFVTTVVAGQRDQEDRRARRH